MWSECRSHLGEYAANHGFSRLSRISRIGKIGSTGDQRFPMLQGRLCNNRAPKTLHTLRFLVVPLTIYFFGLCLLSG